MLKVDAHFPDPVILEYAADLVKRGQVICTPTDTFYGLAADPFNLYAIEEIFQIKGRPAYKPILLLVATVEQAEELAPGKPPDLFFALARRFWPGPLTMVIRASGGLPLKITGNTGKVAVRLPAAKIPVNLIRMLDMPLTGTSANVAGMAECCSAEQVQNSMGERVSLILDGGESTTPLPSTIIDVSDGGWRLVREGAIPAEQIAEFLSA